MHIHSLLKNNNINKKGTIKIELYIDGVYRVQQLDLNTEKPAVTFDKSIF